MMVGLSSVAVLLLLLVVVVGGGSAAPSAEYMHLAFTSVAQERLFGFYTSAACPSKACCAVNDEDNNNNNVTVMCGSSSTWEAKYGYNHEVLFAGLAPGRYSYSCGCGERVGGAGWSDSQNFSVRDDLRDEPFTVGTYADMGVDYSEDTVKRMVAGAEAGLFDFVLHSGDIAYYDDHFWDFRATWNGFSKNVQPISSRMPYMVMPGNHDFGSHIVTASKHFKLFNDRWKMPGNITVTKNHPSMFYSFNYKTVHFVCYSTETSFPGAPLGSVEDFGDEVAWLKQDLAEANRPENRAKQPWVIVLGHRPIYAAISSYCSQSGEPINEGVSNALTLQKVFEDIFYENRVDLILNGHVHAYSRNYPAYRNKRIPCAGDDSLFIKPKAPISVVYGNAGNIERIESGWIDPQPEWEVTHYSGGYGYAHLSVHNASALTWTAYRSKDGGVQDEFTIVR